MRSQSVSVRESTDRNLKSQIGGITHPDLAVRSVGWVEQGETQHTQQSFFHPLADANSILWRIPILKARSGGITHPDLAVSILAIAITYGRLRQRFNRLTYWYSIATGADDIRQLGA
ncbi:hypothetical protein [Chamaesiphon sp. GL140_3_metabinner_50]|uniref:hypothetical protein n=1 Tax=Chamaesiphon sp. GL140_3_metabinner_50 TaxID=2970812 RepID=UPI0025F29708|nr:hypothetical protein [Chamaesiphon sp. GL140_3_metabinner_50]